MSNYWKTWIKAAGIRAVKTMAQTAGASLSIGAAMSDINWVVVGSTALVAGIYSLITSLAGLPECKDCEEEDESNG